MRSRATLFEGVLSFRQLKQCFSAAAVAEKLRAAGSRRRHVLPKRRKLSCDGPELKFARQARQGPRDRGGPSVTWPRFTRALRRGLGSRPPSCRCWCAGGGAASWPSGGPRGCRSTCCSRTPPAGGPARLAYSRPVARQKKGPACSGALAAAGVLPCRVCSRARSSPHLEVTSRPSWAPEDGVRVDLALLVQSFFEDVRTRPLGHGLLKRALLALLRVTGQRRAGQSGQR